MPHLTHKAFKEARGQERATCVENLCSLNRAIADFDLRFWFLLRVCLPILGLLALPIVSYQSGHGLGGEVFVGGVVIYAVLLAFELYTELGDLKDELESSSPQAKNSAKTDQLFLVLVTIVFSISLPLAHNFFALDKEKDWGHLVCWIAAAAWVGGSGLWLQLRIDGFRRTELRNRLTALQFLKPIPAETLTKGPQ